MADTSIPSLFNAPAPRPDAAAAPDATSVASLLDLLYDGFYMLFLLRNRCTPTDAEVYRNSVRKFLQDFERNGKRQGASADDLYHAKFAFCALVDEVVLMSQLRIRADWERKPLQLEYFGEQLAGERFFDYLESLRAQGALKVQLLEVFHMCLLMGFQGKYLMEGSEKLGYLTSRVGDEIARHKGRTGSFAPHWAAPDRVAHALRSEVPLWVVASVFALVGLTGFLGIRWVLQKQTAQDLAPYSEVVKLPAAAAHVTITLP